MISEDRLARQTNAARKGRDDGQEELPPPNATTLSDAENEIVGIVQREVDKVEEVFRGKLEASRNIDVPSVPVAKQTFLSRVADADNDISAQVASYRDRLVHMRLDELRANRQLTAFKRDNGLNREAHYSSGWWTLGILLLCVGLETAVNAWFFGEASDRGLAGGAATAALISGANVALSFVTAWIPLRYTHDRRHWHKLWALPMLCLCFIFIIGFNFAVGHYRELLIGNPDAHVFRVIESLLTNPLGIQQIESWVLVIFGFVISIIALYKGFLWDDTYPRFARMDKFYRGAREDFQGAKEAFREDLKEITDKHSDAINRQVEDVRAAVANATTVAMRLTQEKASLRTEVAGLEEACNRVLNIYRTENKAVRDPTPSPAYFSDSYKLRSVSDWTELTLVENSLAEMKTALSEIEDESRRAKEEIAARLSGEVEQIDRINEAIDVEARQAIDEEAQILASGTPSVA